MAHREDGDAIALMLNRDRASVAAGESRSPVESAAGTPPIAFWVAGVAVLVPAFLWSYWPTLEAMVASWNREPDYSHGFLVPPLALLILWVRRDLFPRDAARFAWSGLFLIAISQAMHCAGGLLYLGALSSWSVPVWIGGVVWLLVGWRVYRWFLPSVAFLFFMVPLPYGVEHMASRPLQLVATRISATVLQLFGQPALAEGNTILMDAYRLEVEQACSGLRLFMGVIALAYFYVAVTRRTWWEKLVLIASVLPVALIANSARIVGTGLLYQWISEEAGKKFTHDVAGWVMVPFAALLFALVLWYLGKVTYEVETADVRAVIGRESG
jgi:exosortase